MWLLCDCQGQNTTELLNFCRDNLPEDIRTGICMPTYDSMKKYQGSWHIEEKTVFPEYFLIKESQRETLRNAFAQWPYTEAFCSSIAETSTQLLPEQEKLLQSFLGKRKPYENVRRIHQRRHRIYYTGSPSGKRKNDPKDRPAQTSGQIGNPHRR